jgi:hypothetical protein
MLRPKMGTILGTPVIYPTKVFTQVVDNNVVGDTGFEPATSTGCKRYEMMKK